VSGALLRPGRHANGRGSLEEVARKAVDWVAESDDPPGHATPLEIKRLNDRPHNVSQRVRGSQTIRNREGVEYTDVSNLKLSSPLVEVSLSSIVRDGSYPESQSRGNSRIVGMQAQRACCREAVKSYERECALMLFSIGTAEPACHEPHVGMEIVRGTVASVQIGPCASQKQVGLRDDAAEVKDL